MEQPLTIPVASAEHVTFPAGTGPADDRTPPTGIPVAYSGQPGAYSGHPAGPYGTDQPVAVVPVVPYEPGGQPAYGYQPPPRPKGPPKSVTGAALLNLTGLGLGYAYLRNRTLLAVSLVVVAAAMTIGFLTGAAAQPWLWRGLTLGWVVILSLHAAFLASRRLSGPRQRKPVVAGAVAVAVVVAGYVGYGFAGSAVYDSGIAAQENGDCATANGKFDTVSGPFELTLSSDVTAADARRAECDAYEKARAAQQHKDYKGAIALYNDFKRIYPTSALKPHVYRNLADTHFARATSWREPLSMADIGVSVDTLVMLHRSFGDTAAAKKVPDAIADVFAAATKPYAQGEYCNSLLALTYFAELDPSIAGEKVVTDATNYRAKSLYECGLAQVRAHDPAAVRTLEQFLEAFPGDGAVPQAKSALITAKVERDAKVQLPFPPPLGGNNPGSIPVTFYNDSNKPVTILVAGPTAHEISLPACGVCPESYPKGDPAACEDLNGRPGVTLRLPPSTYYMTTENPNVRNQVTGSITPLVGYEHWQCVYTTRY